MPPRCRNQRAPTAEDTPIASAALSLGIPVAICTQNCRSTSRRSAGGPGERIASLPVNCFIHPAGRPINTSWLKVLRRPVESAQYTSVAFGKRCEEMGVKPSMGTVGDAYDNAMAESFFATLECELIDRRSWKTKTEARLAIFTWIESWYNPLRRHSGIGQCSPNAFERRLNSEKSDIDIIEANDLVTEGQSVR